MKEDFYIYSKGKLLLILLCLALIGLTIAAIFVVVCMALLPGKYGIITSTLAQDILFFILPPLFLGWIVTRHPFRFTMLNTEPRWRDVFFVLLALVTSLPVLNYIVDLNENLTFPQQFSELEKWLRASEDSAKNLTDTLISTSSVWGLIINILIVGLLTGFSEELFFRGGLLRPFLSGNNTPHFAIWTVAFVFSAVHMQFFGFFPRLLMGAWFGYLFCWTRSLWVPIIAHALNNSTVVVTQYMENNHIADLSWVEKLGVPAQGEFPWIALASLIAVAIVIFLARKALLRTGQNQYHPLSN